MVSGLEPRSSDAKSIKALWLKPILDPGLMTGRKATEIKSHRGLFFSPSSHPELHHPGNLLDALLHLSMMASWSGNENSPWYCLPSFPKYVFNKYFSEPKLRPVSLAPLWKDHLPWLPSFLFLLTCSRAPAAVVWMRFIPQKKSAADRPLDDWPLFRRCCQWEEHCYQITITCY